MPAENESHNVPGGQHAIVSGNRLPDKRVSWRPKHLAPSASLANLPPLLLAPLDKTLSANQR